MRWLGWSGLARLRGRRDELALYVFGGAVFALAAAALVIDGPSSRVPSQLRHMTDGEAREACLLPELRRAYVSAYCVGVRRGG